MEELVVINYYNISATNISKSPVMHPKPKHISIKYHFVREQMLEKEVRLEYVPI